jgi:hypothetical protein
MLIEVGIFSLGDISISLHENGRSVPRGLIFELAKVGKSRGERKEMLIAGDGCCFRTKVQGMTIMQIFSIDASRLKIRKKDVQNAL